MAKKRKVNSYCSLGSYFQQYPAIATRYAIRTVSHPDCDINLASKVNYLFTEKEMLSFWPEEEHTTVLRSDGSMNNITFCNGVGFLIFSDIDV